ncbi:flagellar hook-length control protein FliK [Bdellovibrio reynosensis]|uniref:Flagellar hook-length control protein FliK n=1 Tax=Bdellovibrio reynosensis TaxID=2835041 RepID=A0ABY4CB02_9BACT|nr:flagellar hook-length control protein FliK [Bdellovibrio reynosensis]UOF00866.1 flagellar hook-length control protein FliK [Bdellovibrio reynosensis]
MLTNIVGPPIVGATTDLKSLSEKAQEKGFKGSGSDSAFGKALEEKISSKALPKDTKESAQKEMRQKENERPQPDAKKTEKEVVKPDGKVAKKATVRQQAIQEFMDSFESEFNISPTRLVEAMAQLDNNQLVQSPEITAQAVIDQLDLPDAEADKAAAMYAALLAQLNQLPQQPKQPEMVAGAGVMSKQNMDLRMAAAQGKQDSMGASVDRLNKNFWMTNQPKEMPGAAPSLEGKLLQNISIDEDSMLSEEMIPQQDGMELTGMETPEAPQAPKAPAPQGPKLEELPPHLQGQMKSAMPPALLAALAAKKAAEAAASAEGKGSDEAALMNEFQQAAQAPKLDKAAPLNAQAAQVNGKAAQEFFQQNQSQGQSWMQQNTKEFAQQGLSKGEAATKLTEKAADFKQSLTGLEGLHGAPIKGETLGMQNATPMAAAAAPQAPVNQAEHDAAVKQLMNQAQYLIKKGGGEMKVEMTPEGMGKIHLKVMLQDGKVNLEMAADTKEAKKAIESSLAELKTSLAAQKLSMENVKVDVVNSTSADTATQNQPNMNGRDQHQQTRQFWNQFNENFGSQGRREGYSEVPNLKGYGAKQRDPLQPVEVASTSARVRGVEGKGSGLNLVA